MRIFEFTDYRVFVRKWLDLQPGKGRGYISKIAEALLIPQPLMSQILHGVKNLNLEQADLLADYFQLNELEREYLFLLIEIERAGRQSLKSFFIKKREQIRKESTEIKSVALTEKALNENEKSVFYSSWLYQAVRILISIEGNQFDTVEKIANELKRDRQKISEIVDFLLKANLCVLEKKHLRIGSRSTHVDSKSPHVQRHHWNWRQVALQKSENSLPEDFFFTAPMSLSIEDYDKLREDLLNFVGNVHKKVANSNPEKVACLNIDFFSPLLK